MRTIEDILGPRTDLSTFLLHLKKDVPPGLTALNARRAIPDCYQLPKTARKCCASRISSIVAAARSRPRKATIDKALNRGEGAPRSGMGMARRQRGDRHPEGHAPEAAQRGWDAGAAPLRGLVIAAHKAGAERA